MVQRSYKFRFYPTKAQQAQLSVEFGHARFVYNFALAARQKVYQRRKETLNYVGLSKLIGQIKKVPRYEFLKQATAGCHTQKLIDLDKAYQSFFSGQGRFPKFKHKDHKQSVRYQLDQRHIAKNFNNGKGQELLKLPKLGALKLRWSRKINGIPKMVTVSKTATGKYFVTMSCEETINAVPAAPMALGVDMGIKDVVALSNGEKVSPLKSHHKNQKKLATLQKQLSRKVKGSNRRNRARLKVARLHEKTANQRSDFNHKLTSRLINENQMVCLEDLHVKGMVKNHKLSKSLIDNSFGELRRQLEYKAEWYGREVQIVDRWYPSSKTCSCCGHVLDKLPLSVREWRCPDCDNLHDRDTNAAINILREGLNQYRGEHGNCPVWENGQGVRRVA